MRSNRFLQSLLVLAITAGCGRTVVPAKGEPISRTEVLEIARSYAEHHWKATPKNVLHGPDHDKVAVNTPDRGAQGGADNPALWTVDAENVGVPYKWGGFDSLTSFDAGVRSGKAAGDLYSSDKRRMGGDAVSGEAVGVDCSGFISRCWKLKQKCGTSTLIPLCEKLKSPSDLLPGDVMNAAYGHVILFVKWLDDSKTRALFYESQPFSKVLTSEYAITDLVAEGMHPLRYRQIHD